MLHHVRTAFVPFAVAALISCALASAAQAFRLSYVSLTGNDHNACTLAAPCRTLTHAIAATTVGGEVRVIDSAGYGSSITIGKSITVSGDGATVFGGPITINNASAVVTLRDVVLNGGGTAYPDDGVFIQAAKTVHIERCTIHGFFQHGIRIGLGSDVDVFVTDSTVRDNGFSGLNVSSGTTARLTVANSHFNANVGDGLGIQSGEAVIDHSSASGNGFSGIDLSAADLTLESSVLRGNYISGLSAYLSTVRLSNSVVTRNDGYGVYNNSSTVLTRQNNTVSGNTLGVSGTLTPLAGI